MKHSIFTATTLSLTIGIMVASTLAISSSFAQMTSGNQSGNNTGGEAAPPQNLTTTGMLNPSNATKSPSAVGGNASATSNATSNATG